MKQFSNNCRLFKVMSAIQLEQSQKTIREKFSTLLTVKTSSPLPPRARQEVCRDEIFACH